MSDCARKGRLLGRCDKCGYTVSVFGPGVVYVKAWGTALKDCPKFRRHIDAAKIGRSSRDNDPGHKPNAGIITT